MALSIKCDSLALRTESREECMICFPNSDHVMFSREFAFCLSLIMHTQARGCTCIRRHLKKQNIFLRYKLKTSIRISNRIIICIGLNEFII